MDDHLDPKTWPAYLDDALTASQRGLIDRHLADCQACRAALDAHRILRRRLEQLAGLLLPPSRSAVVDRGWIVVRSRLDEPKVSVRQTVRGLAFGLIAAVALGLFALALGALLRQQVGPASLGSESSAANQESIRPSGHSPAFTLTLNLNAAYATAYSNAPSGAASVRYSLELYNNGPDVASSVRVTTTIPALLTYLDGTITAGAEFMPDSNTVVWVGTLQMGETQTIDYVCGVPDSIGWPGVVMTSTVTVDDDLHPPYMRRLAVNFTPWPTVVPTDGPVPTRTPWITPTLIFVASATPLPYTPTPWLTPTPAEPLASIPPPPTMELQPTSAPGGEPTFTPTLWVPRSATSTPTPWVPSGPTFTSTPWIPSPPPLVTPTPTATPTPWIPGSPTFTPWLSPTPIGQVESTSTPWIPSPPPPATPTPTATPTPREPPIVTLTATIPPSP
jgi:uncharacterized repeat protein (TIGR01451 family)